MIIVNGFQRLTIITKHSILDVAAALDPSLISLKLRICLRNSCVVYLYYYRIHVFYFTVILYMITLVGLEMFYFLCISYKMFYVQ